MDQLMTDEQTEWLDLKWFSGILVLGKRWQWFEIAVQSRRKECRLNLLSRI